MSGWATAIWKRDLRYTKAAQDCCIDGFTKQVRDIIGVVGNVLLPSTAALIHDLFKSIPLTNIGSETRFASMQTRAHSSRGHPGIPPTLAAGHVLGEAKLAHDAGLESLLYPQCVCVCVCCN